MVIGENVLIRPVEAQDLPSISKWSHIFDLQELFSFTTDFTRYDDIVDKLGSIERFPSSMYFTIVDKDEKGPLGECMLTDIDYANKNCLCSLYIGDEDMRDKGLGIEAMMLLMGFAFFELDMNRMGFYVSDYNKRAIKSSKECGFKVEGMMREGIYRGGRYHDVYYMGIIKSEFTQGAKGVGEVCLEENM